MSSPYKSVLTIGATSGIGLGMAEKLVLEGSKVIAVSRRQDRIDDFIHKHRSKADGLTYYIDDSERLDDFVRTATSKHLDIDCVFLKAGIQGMHDFSKPRAGRSCFVAS